MDSIRREAERSTQVTETEERELLRAKQALDSYMIDHLDDLTSWTEYRKRRTDLLNAARALGRKQERGGVER